MGPSIGERAQALGHELAPDWTGSTSRSKRFSLVCSCGYATNRAWSRAHTFSAAQQHVIDVVRAAEQLRPDEVDEDGVSLPLSSS